MDSTHPEVPVRQCWLIRTHQRLIYDHRTKAPSTPPTVASCGRAKRQGSVRNSAVAIAVAVGASLMLILGAVLTLPYGYFSLLRVIIFGCTAYLAWLLFQVEQLGWALTMGGVALLFNPFLPVYLTRGIWQVIDVGVAGLMIASVVVLHHLKAR